MRRIITAGFICVLVGTAAYSPVFIYCGFHQVTRVFSALNDPHVVDPPLSSKRSFFLTGYNALTFLGTLQSPIVFLIMVFSLIGKSNWTQWKASSSREDFGFHACNMLTWMVCFLFHGGKAEYLLPLLVSLAVLIDCIPAVRLRVACCAVLLSYNFITLGVVGGPSGYRTIELSVKQGYTFHIVDMRRWTMSIRRAAADFHPDKPTIFIFDGEPWIRAVNPRWVKDDGTGLYKQIDGQLYVSSGIASEERLQWLTKHGFRLVLWDGQKGDYVASGPPHWRDYISVVPSLDDFFGCPIQGESEH
jgi:hypothetical protein